MMIKASDERFCLVRVCLSFSLAGVIYAARRDLHGEHRASSLPRRALSLNARPGADWCSFPKLLLRVMIRARRVGNNKLAKCSGKSANC